MNQIVHGDSYVTLHYRIRLGSGSGQGETFIETFSSQPSTLQMGAGQWLEAMEQPLIGMHEGEQKSFTVPAAQAYGLRNPELYQYVSRQMLAENAGEEAEFNDNDLVEFTAPNGAKYSGYFRRWEGDKALFDFNHPLAGIDLLIDVSIIGVL
ncbi:FKBP-type peptidyl-prolyl cis-trans isomerase [Brackiella oedipodis]|uniref:FKBP-type peptidyl-prolyl cis-trans isomerase n=1 Tax=Brackiella oedipodis TaxID=124225 RepID=UPI0004907866|nr:FKBP-type peptidyl-prolyl cis-trans isomerase [Brackiella oedipodis]